MIHQKVGAPVARLIGPDSYSITSGTGSEPLNTCIVLPIIPTKKGNLYIIRFDTPSGVLL